MGYLAASTDSVLLKYLHLKCSSNGQPVALEDIVRDLRAVEDSSRDVHLYDFLDDDPKSDPALVRDILYLQGLGFVQYSADNPHVRLTEWGRFFAELFELPAGVKERLATAGS
jgi:hypothetical protein